MTGTARIIRGDALALPLPDESVDLVVTSPPYWALRQYTDNGTAYNGQIGAEATVAEFIDNLVAATAEMVRVLKPTGSGFVNLGDKYGSDKSLLMLPERYRIAIRERLGVIVRATVVWSKPNGLPESVTDRVRRSHEDWVHFTKSPRYFSAVDEIREASVTGDRVMFQSTRGQSPGMPLRGPSDLASVIRTNNPLGKLPGSVWTIATQPLRVPDHLGVDHFAAFPMEWPRRIIRGWAPTAGVCTSCGEGRRPVAAKAAEGCVLKAATTHLPGDKPGPEMGRQSDVRYTITGYACACPDTTAPTTPPVILDPFGGTGTTALVAKALGCTGISVDLSHDYCRLATWRTNDRDQLAAAMQVDKPTDKPLDGQLGLFGDDAA
jgi:DNA modification methylase